MCFHRHADLIGTEFYLRIETNRILTVLTGKRRSILNTAFGKQIKIKLKKTNKLKNMSWFSQPQPQSQMSTSAPQGKTEERKSFFDTVKLAVSANGLTRSNTTPAPETTGSLLFRVQRI